MDETILITVALIIGFIGGALARQSKLRQLAEEKAALIRQCAELFTATLYFQHINQQPGRAMEAAGMQVERIGECDCSEVQESVLEQAASSVSVDPFARNKDWATYTNDLNPQTKAMSQNARLYSACREAALKILTDDAIVVSCGWNSSGMGIHVRLHSGREFIVTAKPNLSE